MYYYVDCACPHHDKWQSFQNKAFAKAYYDWLTCPEKILYVDADDDSPNEHFTLETTRKNQ